MLQDFRKKVFSAVYKNMVKGALTIGILGTSLNPAFAMNNRYNNYPHQTQYLNTTPINNGYNPNTFQTQPIYLQPAPAQTQYLNTTPINNGYNPNTFQTQPINTAHTINTIPQTSQLQPPPPPPTSKNHKSGKLIKKQKELEQDLKDKELKNKNEQLVKLMTEKVKSELSLLDLKINNSEETLKQINILNKDLNSILEETNEGYTKILFKNEPHRNTSIETIEKKFNDKKDLLIHFNKNSDEVNTYIENFNTLLENNKTNILQKYNNLLQQENLKTQYEQLSTESEKIDTILQTLEEKNLLMEKQQEESTKELQKQLMKKQKEFNNIMQNSIEGMKSLKNNIKKLYSRKNILNLFPKIKSDIDYYIQDQKQEELNKYTKLTTLTKDNINQPINLGEEYKELYQKADEAADEILKRIEYYRTKTDDTTRSLTVLNQTLPTKLDSIDKSLQPLT